MRTFYVVYQICKFILIFSFHFGFDILCHTKNTRKNLKQSIDPNMLASYFSLFVKFLCPLLPFQRLRSHFIYFSCPQYVFLLSIVQMEGMRWYNTIFDMCRGTSNMYLEYKKKRRIIHLDISYLSVTSIEYI